jgi:hypothetical protein
VRFGPYFQVETILSRPFQSPGRIACICIARGDCKDGDNDNSPV